VARPDVLQEKLMERDKPLAKGNDKREAKGPLGAHPVGTAVGGVAGATATGAAVGSAAGPLGTVVGAAVGALAGGVAGAMVAEAIDPAKEDNYWRASWMDRDYADPSLDYEKDYGPAYRYGVEGFVGAPDKHFEELEPELSTAWRASRGESRLDWDRARPATLDAWQRARDQVERLVPGQEVPPEDVKR
jgi:hypothetical protein